MHTKVCLKCRVEKELSSFNKTQRGCKHGLRSECKECSKKRLNLYKKTENGLSYNILTKMKERTNMWGFEKIQYGIDEFRNWMFSQTNFQELYHNWVNSGYKKDMRPSVDRKDDYKGYTFPNMQLMTFGDNRSKYFYDVKNGINNKANKSISQYTKKDIFIEKYFSISEASRVTETNVSNITQCCLNNRETAGGFKWKYNN